MAEVVILEVFLKNLDAKGPLGLGVVNALDEAADKLSDRAFVFTDKGAGRADGGGGKVESEGGHVNELLEAFSPGQDGKFGIKCCRVKYAALQGRHHLGHAPHLNYGEIPPALYAPFLLRVRESEVGRGAETAYAYFFALQLFDLADLRADHERKRDHVHPAGDDYQVPSCQVRVNYRAAGEDSDGHFA